MTNRKPNEYPTLYAFEANELLTVNNGRHYHWHGNRREARVIIAILEEDFVSIERFDDQLKIDSRIDPGQIEDLFCAENPLV